MRVTDEATSTTTTTAAPTSTSTTTVAPTSTSTTSTTAEPAADEEEAETYRVLKAFTLDDGQTLMPGEKFSPGEVKQWPARRSKQLVEQKFLRPIKK